METFLLKEAAELTGESRRKRVEAARGAADERPQRLVATRWWQGYRLLREFRSGHAA